MDDHQAAYDRIGGWLVLIAIGLVAAPVRVGYFVISHAHIFFDEGWLRLTDPASPAYHPMWGPVLLFETLVNMGFAICSIGLLVLMLQKSILFPKLFITVLIANALLVTADHFLASQIPAVAVQANSSTTQEMVRSIGGACIWVPYTLKSKRVKATFRRREPPVAESPTGRLTAG